MVNKENTSPEIKNFKSDIAFVPVAATEQHSSHLPVKTDAFIAEKIMNEVVKKVKGYLLPVMPFGTSIENMGGAGTVTLMPPTLRLVVRDLVDSLYRQGYKIIFVVSFHGGNFILKPTVRELNYERKEGRVFYLEPFGDSSGGEPDLHSGYTETSLMMYLWKKEINLKGVKGSGPVYKRSDLDWIGMVEATEGKGCWGFPEKAGCDKGKIIFEQRVSACVKEIGRILKLYNR